jgi:ArsR family transcriptional regulator, arsenate/arsenite/antimonite-responsive transcriptional repressor
MYKLIDTEKKDVDVYSELSELLRALSDETRQEILKVVTSQKEICVNDIAGHFKLSRPTISHHLNLMRRVKLLNSRKEGKEIYYSFNKAYVTKVLKSFLTELEDCAC